MSTEVIKVDSAGLVSVYEGAEGRVAKAKEIYATKYKDAAYTPETAPNLEAFEGNLKKAKTEINAARSPFTRQLAEITKLFTGIENELDGMAVEIAQKRTDWKRAEAARQAAEIADKEREAQKGRVLGQFKPTVEQILTDMLHDTKVSYINALVAKTEPEPFVLTDEAWKGVCRTAVTRIGGADFVSELAASIQADKPLIIEGWNADLKDWTTATDKSKGNLNALKNIGKMLGQTYQEAVAAIEQQKEVAQFEAEVAAAEIVQPTGPVIKKKLVCQPADYKEALMLFNYWMGIEKPEMSDVLKMISKCVTMANRMGLKGESLEGVTFIEDVK